MLKTKVGSKNIRMTPLRIQIVTAEEFLVLYEQKASEIRSAKIIPPRLGNKDFGKIMIEWKNPVFVSLASVDCEALA